MCLEREVIEYHRSLHIYKRNSSTYFTIVLR